MNRKQLPLERISSNNFKHYFFPQSKASPACAYCCHGLPTLIPITWGCHISDGSFCYIGHESHNGKDDKASEHAGEGVDAADNDRISVRERQSTRQPLSRLYQFLINPSHIVERHGGKGRSRAILYPAVALQLNTFILTCSLKMAVSSHSFRNSWNQESLSLNSRQDFV